MFDKPDKPIHQSGPWHFNRICLLLIVAMTGLTATSIAQVQGNFWYFGKKAALDFTGFDPVPLSNSLMDAPEGAAAISDSTGKLLFYTDGVSLWNSNHVQIKTGMSGDLSSTQSATIVPDPDTVDQYFIFTTKAFVTGSQTNYGGNFYKVRIKPGETGTVIYDYSAATGIAGLVNLSTEKFVAVPFTRPDEKTGYWFLMHEFNTNKFIKIKYDGTFSSPVPQSIGSVHANDTIDDGTNRGAAGQMKVNDAGTRIALAVEGGKFFELIRFNTGTGNLSASMKIPAGDAMDKFAFKYSVYGVEFSPTGRFSYALEPGSGNFLYGTTRNGQIYQFDLSNENDYNQFVKTSKILYSNPEMECGAMQMAPNGKIYIAFNGQDFLGVINSPMRALSRFEESGVRLSDNGTNLGGSSGIGLPGPLAIPKIQEPFYFENVCLGLETLFYITDEPSITPNTPRVWRIVKVGGGATVSRTSTLNELRYTFPSPGEYTVMLTVFKSGNPVSYSRKVTINPLPVVQLIENNVKDTFQLCRGTSITLDAGYGAFYEWEDVSIKDRSRTVTTNDDFFNFYRVKVTDYHGCVGWDTVIIRREIPPTATHTSKKAFCGNSDGNAVVIPNGKIENFTYTWENYPNEKSNTLSGINGGDYVVHVYRPSTTCSVTDTIHVDELGGSSVNIISSGDSIVCPGEPITLSVTSAAEIEWLFPAGLSGNNVTVSLDTTTIVRVRAISRDEGRECETFVSDTIFVFPKNPPRLGPDLTPCGGNPISIDGGAQYLEWNWSDGQTGRFAKISKDIDNLILNATDTNGCVFADTVGVHFLPGPVVNLGRDTAACSKDPIVLRGGTGDSYLWNTGETTQTILAKATGDYSVSITLAGCSLTDSIHVQLNDPALFHFTGIYHEDITCFGASNGKITIEVTGEGRNFYYSIDGGLTYFENQGIFENLPPASDYSIKILEDSVCSISHPLPVEITQPDSLAAKFCTLPTSCKDCSDGEITVARIAGGTPPYEIRMNGVLQNSREVKQLDAGTYIFNIIDIQKCEITDTIILADGTRPKIVSETIQPVCSGMPVTLRVENSNQVEWENPPGNKDLEIVVHPVVTTIYVVRSIKTDPDGFACETLLQFTVTVKPFIKPELGADINACEGDTVNLDGGDFTSWDWSNGMTVRAITLMQTPVNPLELKVTDNNGCEFRDTISVYFNTHPAVELGKDQSVCSSSPVTLTGGTGDTYHWTSDVLTGPLVTKDIEVTKSGRYYLTITTKGCSSTDSVNIKILDPDSFSIKTVNVTNNTCYGGDNGSLEIIMDDTVPVFLYSIDDGFTYQTSNSFENLPAGTYDQIRVLADSLCFRNFNEPVVIGQPDSIQIKVRLKSPGCETCNDGVLTLQIAGGTPPYQITLSGAPIGLVTETLGIGTYKVAVTDANSCLKEVDFTLEMLNVVPNVITTNGDGINDKWLIPMLKYYPDAIVKVFTITGKLVFESKPGYPDPWDGREDSNPLPMGTYYYLINLGSGEKPLTGYLTILR
ncbi:MAG: gliding motility-associated C-terminal domain-containing protein [Bacteroidales bacterium]